MLRAKHPFAGRRVAAVLEKLLRPQIAHQLAHFLGVECWRDACHLRLAALSGADLYVGDGSTLKGSLVRRHATGALMGHTTVRAQLGWLAKYGISRAVFSHFGTARSEMGSRP